MSNIRNIATRAAVASALDTFKDSLSRLSGSGAHALIFQAIQPRGQNVLSKASSDCVVLFNTTSKRFVGTLPVGGIPFANWPGCERYGEADDKGVKPIPGEAYFCVADGKWYTPDSDSYDLVEIDPVVTRNTFFDDLLASLDVKPAGADGLYSLNGLTDITYKQMVDIVAAGRLDRDMVSGFYCRNTAIRTHLPANIHPSSAFIADYLFWFCENLEVVNESMIVPSDHTFAACPSLRKISCYSPNNDRRYDPSSFEGCVALEEIDVWNVSQQNIWLGDSPLLSFASVSGIVAKYGGAKLIQFTVHPEVYAKLTDESNAQWHPLLAAAEAKKIQFLSA